MSAYERIKRSLRWTLLAAAIAGAVEWRAKQQIHSEEIRYLRAEVYYLRAEVGRLELESR